MKKLSVTLIFLSVLSAQAVFAAGVRLIFTGDIMTHVQQLEAAKRDDGSYDFSQQFEKIRAQLSGDLVIGNFETTLAGAKRGFTGYPSFSTPDELADELKDIGFHVLLLANNHIYDKGVSGLKRTADELRSRGFTLTGAWGEPAGGADNYPLLMEVNGIKIGIFNYSYGSNTPINKKTRAETHLNIINEVSIKEDIGYLKDSGADFIIAAFHWGVEYRPQPSKRQREIADMCFREGVDIIVGTHPHILQPIEIFEADGKTRVAAYSLGNFVSFQRSEPRERSAILAVNISREPVSSQESEPPLSISEVSVFPVYTNVIGGGKSRVVQVVPASEKPEKEKAVLEFLNAPGGTDDLGFYLLFQNRGFSG